MSERGAGRPRRTGARSAGQLAARGRHGRGGGRDSLPAWRRPFAGGLITGGLVTGAAAALVFALAFALGPGGRGDDVERIAADLRQAEAARDRQAIVELTALARAVRAELGPVLEGMARALPPPGATARPAAPATRAEVVAWQGTTRAARARFGAPPSGSTGYNVARSSLVAAVESLDGAVGTYLLGLDLRAEQRSAALDSAAAQRDLAVRTWSVAATQIDAVNIDAGNGHQHVYLQAGAGAGAMTADPAPEGSEARP